MDWPAVLSLSFLRRTSYAPASLLSSGDGTVIVDYDLNYGVCLVYVHLSDLQYQNDMSGIYTADVKATRKQHKFPAAEGMMVLGKTEYMILQWSVYSKHRRVFVARRRILKDLRGSAHRHMPVNRNHIYLPSLVLAPRARVQLSNTQSQ